MAAITATVLSVGRNPLQNARPRPLRSLLITSPIHLRRFNPLQLQVRLHLTTRPISRRNLWVAATSLWDAITSSLTGGQNSAHEAALAVRRGMQLFVQGDVEQSVVEFDKAIELDPRQKKYLWQRGLSLYYLNRFEEGATQFRDDVAANPNDTEESIWCFLCEAQIDGVDEARRRFLEVGPDPRPVMRKAYLMFKNGGDPQEDHARRTGTHGEMISSDLHGAEDPTRWMLRPQQGKETGRSVVPWKKRRTHQKQLRRPIPRGVEPSPREHWPWKAQEVFQDIHDVTQQYGRFGRQLWQFWYVWQLGEAQGGLTFFSRRLHLPWKGLTSP